jgi:hypothetical protein
MLNESIHAATFSGAYFFVDPCLVTEQSDLSGTV